MSTNLVTFDPSTAVPVQPTPQAAEPGLVTFDPSTAKPVQPTAPPQGGLGGWVNRVLPNNPDAPLDDPAWGMARGVAKSGGRGMATLLDLAAPEKASPEFEAGYRNNHPNATPQEIQAAWMDRGGLTGKIAGHLRDASAWLKQGSEPEGFWEKMGMVGEQMLEWFGPAEVLKMTEAPRAAGVATEVAGKAARAGENLKNAQQTLTVLQKNPRLAGLVGIGLKASQEAAGMGAQTYLHTEDPKQAAIAAGIGGTLSAALPATASAATRAARWTLDKFAPETIDIGEQTAIPVAKGQLSKEGEILPTGTKNEPQIARAQQAKFDAHVQNSARVAAANSLRGLVEAQRPVQRLALPAPEGAEPFQFTLRGTPTTEGVTGPLTQGAEQIPRTGTARVPGAPTEYVRVGEPEYIRPGDTGLDAPWAQREGSSWVERRAPGYLHPQGDVEVAEDVAQGGGVLRSADPQEAVQWRNHYEHLINSPEFKELPEAQQQQILANYDRLKNELGMYYSRPHGAMPQLDVDNIVSRIHTPSDAAAQITAANGYGWQELNRISDGEISRLNQQVQDAKATIYTPNASAESKAAARAARNNAQARIDKLITDHAGDTPVTRAYYKAMKQGHSDATFLNNLDDEIESMVNGVTRENTKSGRLVRVVTGNTKGLEEFLAQGQNRANLQRLIGSEAETNLKAFTELLAEPGTTRKTGTVLANVAKELGAHIGAGAMLWGPAYLMGAGTKGAALGQTLALGTYGARLVLRLAAQNPNVGRLVEYAVKNSVDAQIYAPLIARTIMTPMQQTQPQQERAQQK